MKLKVWPLVKNLIALIESQEEELLEHQEEIAGLLVALAKEREDSALLAQELAQNKGNDLRPWNSLEGEPKA